MRFNQIKETCLYSLDLEKTREFYENELGLEVIGFIPNEHIFFRAGTSVLLFFNPKSSRKKVSPPSHFASGKQHIAFEVPLKSYNSCKRQLNKKGIRIIDEISWGPKFKSFYFEDPNGHVLEIVPEGMWNS